MAKDSEEFEKMSDEYGKTQAAAEATKRATEGAAVAAGELAASYQTAEATLKSLKNQQENISKFIKEGKATLVDQVELYGEINRAEDELLRQQIILIQNGVELVDAGIEQAKIQEEINKLNEERKKDGKEELSNEKAILQILNNKRVAFRNEYRGIVAIEKETSKVAESMGLQRDYQNSTLRSIISASKEEGAKSAMMKVGLTTLHSYVNANEILYKLATETLKAGVDYTKQLFAQSIELNKQIGMARRFRDNLQDTALISYALAGGLEGATKAIQGMTTEYSDFTLLSDEVQNSLIQTSIKMEMIGVSASDFAKSMQVLTKSMGYSAKEAEAMNIGLTEFASSIGQAPSQMLADFAVAMPKLAVYGQRAEEVFRGLARRSKETGLSIDSLVGVTERMDTFEGAAEAAMQLNSALGGAYFDSTQLLLADEEERLAIIKDTLKAQGIQFNQMGKFEQKMLAQAAGFSNVAEMAAFMNGEMGNTEGGESFNEMVTASTDLMVQLKAVFLAAAKPFADFLIPIIQSTSGVLKEFLSDQENLKMAGYGLTIIMGLLAIKVGLITGPILAVSAVVIGLISYWDELMEVLEAGWNKITSLGKFFSSFFGGDNKFEETRNVNLVDAKMAAIGTSSSPGGMTIVGERGPEIMNVPRGSQISPASRTADIQTSIESLANAVSKLAAQNGGGNNKPIQVNLTVDGKKLAEAVFNNTSYSDFG